MSKAKPSSGKKGDVMDWLKSKNGNGFSESMAKTALSTVLGKAGKPKSVKLKIKYGGSEKKKTTKRRTPHRAPHTAGIK